MSQLEAIILIILFIFTSPIILLGVISMCLEEFNWILRTIDDIKGKRK